MKLFVFVGVVGRGESGPFSFDWKKVETKLAIVIVIYADGRSVLFVNKMEEKRKETGCEVDGANRLSSLPREIKMQSKQC